MSTLLKTQRMIILQFLKFEGQSTVFNEETKTLFLTIEEPFYSAGKLLSWEKPDPGIGLNLSIINFIKKYKCHLVIKVAESNHSYWIYYDSLISFMNNNNCDYTISGKNLKVISWKKFIRLTEHIGV
jgi:hypothetical protein